MSINPLNDISRVYLEQVAAVEEGVRPTPVEKPLDKAAFKKRRRSLAGKEKSAEARARGHEGKEWYNSGRTYSPDEAKRMRSKLDDEERRTRHRSAVEPDNESDDSFSADKTKNPKKLRKQKAMGELGESAVPGKPAEKLGAVTAIPKDERDAARERTLAKAKAMREKKAKRWWDDDGDGKGYEPGEVSGKFVRKEAKETPKRWWDDDGDGKGYEKGEVSGKFKRKKIKEGYSNWREDLIEVSEFISKDKNDQKITEKSVKNKIKINPTMGEAVENLGGTLLEMVEIDEFDFILESAYDELLDEGYGEDDVEEALEFALTEAKVTFGHDTPTTEKKKESLLSIARKKLSGVKKAAKAAIASGARKVAKGALGVASKMEGGDKTPSAAHSKSGVRSAKTYRGAGAGSIEKAGSPKPKEQPKKAEKPADPWAGAATTPPKAKKKKAAAPKAKAPTASKPKAKRKSKLDDLLASVRSEETQLDEIAPLVAGGLAIGGAALAAKAIADRMSANRKKVTTPSTAKPNPASTSSLSDRVRARNQQIQSLSQSYELDGNQINEKTLTSSETKEKERIVKSMKDKAADFERRYPGRGKEVMYATATKLAKKIAK